MPRLIDDPLFINRREAFKSGAVEFVPEEDGEGPGLRFSQAELLHAELIYRRPGRDGEELGFGVMVERGGYYFVALSEVRLGPGGPTIFHTVSAKVARSREEAQEAYEEFIAPCREVGANFWSGRY